MADTTTFPRLQSAGLRGAKALGTAQIVTVTIKATTGNEAKGTSIASSRDASSKEKKVHGNALSSPRR